MNEFSQLISDHWSEVVIFLLVLGRTSGVVLGAPFWGGTTVPRLVRAVIIVSLSVAVYPFVHLTSVQSKQDLPSLIFLLVALGREVVIGLAIGWTAQLLFAGLRLAGQQIEMKMGIGLAQLIDPHDGGHTGLLPALLDLVAALVFLSANGHHLLIKTLAASYHSFPLVAESLVVSGPETLPAPARVTPAPTQLIVPRLAQVLVETAGGIFVIALRVSAPVVVGLLLSDVILGVMSRVVPQLNLFAVILSVQFGLGILLLLLSLPLCVWFCVNQLSVISEQLSTFTISPGIGK
jgi:flagellar biosynthetic protein FliR